MAENNLGNTQYFRTRPDQEIQVKEVLADCVQCNGGKRI